MNINHIKLRELFNDFWKKNNHKEVPSIPLVPKDDPTTLFTGSGMQQLVPYLLGETHPLGKRLFNIQRCIRAQDIEEVGDNRHDTFFEMMGNWSLGDYFKKEQLSWLWEFLTEELKLPKEKLFVSVFDGEKNYKILKNNLPQVLKPDLESIQVWKKLLNTTKYQNGKLGFNPDIKIYLYDANKNWWSRSGAPKEMPVGEVGGPDSEIFYDFGADLKMHEKSIYSDQPCHINCDCGRFLEIGNSVFMQYKKTAANTVEELPTKNVDFGGGLERILAALNDDPDVFKTEVFWPVIEIIQKTTTKNYEENKKAMRIIADHMKTAVFLHEDGVEPSNKEQGYVMRRLIRRAVVQMMELGIIPLKVVTPICEAVVKIYPNYFGQTDFLKLHTDIEKEVASFEKTIHRGVKILQNQKDITGKLLFDLKQSYGFPIEISIELMEKWGRLKNKVKLLEEFQNEVKKHQELSRSSSAGKFKGGLADQSEQTLKYHTATHLLHQALFDVLGQDVRQEGSNITPERLRFDYYATRKPTEEEIKKVESIINEKIAEGLEVVFKIIPKEDALKLGAKSFFREKYPDMVKVYFIGKYSKEFCGGPHVKNTREIGAIKIFKSEKIGGNLYRIYAK